MTLYGFIFNEVIFIDNSSSEGFLKLVGWLVVLRINVDLAIFQQYRNLEAGDNQSLKIQVARPGIEPPVLLLRKPRA